MKTDQSAITSYKNDENRSFHSLNKCENTPRCSHIIIYKLRLASDSSQMCLDLHGIYCNLIVMTTTKINVLLWILFHVGKMS